MPLKIELKPSERMIINGALIKNLDRKSVFLVEGPCKFLRESEIIRESEADTPAKKLCVTLQMLYLSDDPAATENLFVLQSTELLRQMPSAAPYLLAIHDEVAAKQYHRAIKAGRRLILHEATSRPSPAASPEAAIPA